MATLKRDLDIARQAGLDRVADEIDRRLQALRKYKAEYYQTKKAAKA